MIPLAFAAVGVGIVSLISGITGSTFTSVARGKPDHALQTAAGQLGSEGGEGGEGETGGGTGTGTEVGAPGGGGTSSSSSYPHHGPALHVTGKKPTASQLKTPSSKEASAFGAALTVVKRDHPGHTEVWYVEQAHRLVTASLNQ